MQSDAWGTHGADRPLVLRPGSDIGPYTVMSIIGAGGQSVVYKVCHRTGVERAAKVPRPDAEGRNAARLAREAHLQSLVNHTNVVRFVDLLHHQRTPVLITEWIPGVRLSTYLQMTDQLGLGPAQRLFHGILDGVEAIHDQGIVHRDLKAANIYIEPTIDGPVPHIGDFGIALRPQDRRPTLTPPGRLVGTPRTMAPEQFDGCAVDGRADLYALGLLLYQVCSGAHPRRSVSQPQQIALSAQPPQIPLQRLCPDVPDQVVAALSACLRPDRDLRVQTCRELRWMLTGEGEPPEPASMLPRTPRAGLEGRRTTRPHTGSGTPWRRLLDWLGLDSSPG